MRKGYGIARIGHAGDAVCGDNVDINTPNQHVPAMIVSWVGCSTATLEC